MKYTLLQLTQAVLRSIKGETVNSISDTEESLAVAGIIKECYGTILARADLPESKTLFELNASGDNQKPVLMTLPTDVYSIDWLKYNAIEDGDTDPVWKDLVYLPIKDFLDYTNQFDVDETEVAEMTQTHGTDSVTFKYRNDGAPTYFTDYRDFYILFDSYDSAVDATLQKTKTTAYGIRPTAWSETDNFTPDLSSQQFVLLLKEAKAMAWQELKSVDNQKAEREARDIRIAMEQKKHKVNYSRMSYYYNELPDYGRK